MTSKKTHSHTLSLSLSLSLSLCLLLCLSQTPLPRRKNYFNNFFSYANLNWHLAENSNFFCSKEKAKAKCYTNDAIPSKVLSSHCTAFSNGVFFNVQSNLVITTSLWPVKMFDVTVTLYNREIHRIKFHWC